jgi:hypothetical protein
VSLDAHDRPVLFSRQGVVAPPKTKPTESNSTEPKK